MSVAHLICGVVLLAAGRKLYWLFVAAVGFAIGSGAGVGVLGIEGGKEWAWVLGIIGGVFGALLAVFFQKVTVAIAGALAGGYNGWVLFNLMEVQSLSWLGFAVGAVAGTILVLRIFDWALIVFSSLAGALMVEYAIPTDGAASGLVFLVAFVIGIAFQATQLVRARERRRVEEQNSKQRTESSS